MLEQEIWQHIREKELLCSIFCSVYQQPGHLLRWQKGGHYKRYLQSSGRSSADIKQDSKCCGIRQEVSHIPSKAKDLHDSPHPYSQLLLIITPKPENVSLKQDSKCCGIRQEIIQGISNQLLGRTLAVLRCLNGSASW